MKQEIWWVCHEQTVELVKFIFNLYYILFLHHLPLPEYTIIPSEPLEKSKHHFLLSQQFLFKRYSKAAGSKMSDSSKMYPLFYVMLDTEFSICIDAQMTAQNTVLPV